MNLGGRLRLFREKLGLSTQKMAEIAGVGYRQAWLRYEKDQHVPGADVLHNLLKTGLNMHWLLTGEGDMFRDKETAQTKEAYINYDEGNFLPVPVFDTREAAGCPVLNFDNQIDGWISLPVTYVTEHLGITPKDICAVYINGDSMEPILEDGGIAILNRSKPAITGAADGVYTFSLADEFYIKRLERQGGKIVVRSDNPAYEPWEITEKKNLNILGRVVGTFKNL